ncbi:MAG TPA: ABC transporter permease [Gemmatimonadaceae bacterium]|nr:ABC transporter permease [Gemmatimonadaceae bacterium]
MSGSMSGSMSAPAYRALLRLLPAPLRERHGREMESLLVEALERSSGLARVGVWIAAAWDVVRCAPVEHLRHWRRRRRQAELEALTTLETTGSLMSALAHDLRFALRAFARQPGATALVVLTLALGVAANTAVFSLLNGLFLRPFAFPQPERLVYLDETAPRWKLEFTGIHYPDFAAWRKDAGRAFEGMALFSDASFNLSDDTGAERVAGAFVTHDFAGVLGIRPVLGRTFTPEEDVPDGPPVVVIGHALWQNRFGGARDAVGKTLRIGGRPRTVVGVMPPEAEFPGGVQLWMPLGGDPTQGCCSYSYGGVGRLRPGVTVEQAKAELFRVHGPVWAQRDKERVVSPRIMPLRERFVADYRVIAGALGTGVVLVLLIACANVASVMLARAVFRQREIAVRMALGASASRVARQLLTESLALAAAAGALGTLVGHWAVRLLLRAVPEQLPGWARFDPDARTVLFSVGVVMVTAVLFGYVPALHARRQQVRDALAAGGTRSASPSTAQRRLLDALVVAEIALASVLLVGGGLLVRAYQHARDVDPGFSADDVLTFRISLPRVRYETGQSQLAFYEELLRRLRALPGVRSAGAITCPPLGCHEGNFLDAEGQPTFEPVVLVRRATPEYIDAMGIRLLHGRTFTDADGRKGGPRVAIVNESFARGVWPGVADPTGRRIRHRGEDSAAWRTVVGVTKDVKHYGLDLPMRPGLYLPAAMFANTDGPGRIGSLAVVIRASGGDPGALVAPAREIVRQMDPELPIYQARTMREALDRSLALRRTFAWMLGAFAGIALALAVGGIYAVLSYVVGRRTHEIGIRMALGAQRAQVLRLVTRQGLALVLVGLLLGLPAAFAATRALSSLLLDVSPRDPLTFAAVAAALALTGTLAALVPARRASSVDPMKVMRAE